MTERWTKATPERALAARAPPQRDIMEIHRLLTHTSETSTRATTKATAIIITGKWRPCVETPRHGVPNTTNNRALERAALLYVDLVGTINSESVGESPYVIMIVDNFSCFKVSKFLKTKPSVVTAAALESYIVTYITPEQVSVPFAPTTEASLRENPKENLINWAYNTSKLVVATHG